jgi:hypothetical protein
MHHQGAPPPSRRHARRWGGRGRLTGGGRLAVVLIGHDLPRLGDNAPDRLNGERPPPEHLDDRCRLPVGPTRPTLRHQRPPGWRAAPRAQRRVERGVIGLEMPSASPAAHPPPRQAHRAEPGFHGALATTGALLPFRLAAGAGGGRAQRSLRLPDEGEGDLLDSEAPDMHHFLQLIEGERDVGHGEREWYHQFHGSLFPALVVSRCEKVWLLFLP